MLEWPLLVLAAGAAITLLVTLWRVGRPRAAVVAVYPGGIELGGSRRRGRVVYALVQWTTDRANPEPCPLAVHLPGGDLAGAALCDWGAATAAVRLGGPPELDIFPFHKDGKIVGVRVGLLPGGPPVEVSVAGKRFSLPLTEEAAVRVLGEPRGRAELGTAEQPRPAG